jgi:hypothetical protein
LQQNSNSILKENQTLEPEVEESVRTVTTLSDNYGTAFGFGFLMNNFGFGVGGELRKVVSPQTELTASLRVTGLRDASEQTFTDFFFGQQIIPNKYQRAFSFPLMFGIRQRLFPKFVQDNYRFFLSASMGPSVALSYPYFDDQSGVGYRFTGSELIQVNSEEGSQLLRLQSNPVNDIFSGLGQGNWHWGGAGEVKLGVDIGDNFTRLSSVEFGYFFYYYPDEIQIMMPNQPEFRTVSNNPNVVRTDSQGDIIYQPFFEPQSFFGTPQITFTFGWLW